MHLMVFMGTKEDLKSFRDNFSKREDSNGALIK